MRGSIWGLLLALTTGAFAQGAAPIFSSDFEKSTDIDSWKKLIETDTLDIARSSDSPKDVHSGSGALRYSFTAVKDQFPAIFCVLGDVSKMQSVDLWLKSDMATAALLVLGEKDEDTQKGERYNIVAYLPAGEWTHVTASIDDFELDGNGPKVNGKLDTDKVAAFGAMDALAVFATGSEDAAAVLGDHSGKQRLCIDDFRILPTATHRRAVSGVAIDTFDRNYLSWLPFKNVKISREAMGGASGGHGMKVQYERGAGRLNAVVHPITPGTLAGVKTIDLTVSSTAGMSLVVNVEETDGGKWFTSLNIPAGTSASKQTVALADLKQQDDSKDADNKLSPEKIKSVTLVDMNFEAGQGAFTVSDIIARR